MDIFVTPFKVMDDSLVGKLLFYDKDVLEEFYNSLVDVKMIEFGYHRFLVFQILFVLINQRVSFVYH
jgi:hypothetical protein